MKKKYSPDTLALHAGYNCGDNLQSRAVPIYATTSYVFRDIQEGADLYALKKPGFLYSRLGSPTVAVLEDRLAEYHGASAGLAVASGSAANSMLLMSLAGPGKNIVSSPHLYGGTSTLMEHTLKRFGISTTFVDLNDLAALEAAIDDNTVAVWGEGVANPSGYIVDLEKVSAVAHKHGLPLIIDNSAAPPPMLNPFDYGADLVTYSLTKLIGGHGTHLGGLILEKGDFDWGATGRFTNYLNAPDPTYDGLNFWEAFGRPKYKEGQSQVVVLKIRLDLLRNFGPTLSPFGAHEFLLGLETLPLRARRQADNAKAVAEHLAAHPKVAWVNYSGLPESPRYELARKYFDGRPGAVFGIGLKGGFEAAVKFINGLELWSHLANILDARSLVIHPASTTHQQLSPEERLAGGVPDDLIRLSVGLEDLGDLISALDKALAGV
ncbi:O-acetylhomoserine aminocarboxypropyltransferase/cysteine synthase [Deltaproteobacteria bacterium OttesenSCG-928-K17]|nr:O-acetylhomoserine aminocarboxypropyltransferase/cysteine synthase [Deltaproteobacteria bacterium OttesenSCG-928-K17]